MDSYGPAELERLAPSLEGLPIEVSEDGVLKGTVSCVDVNEKSFTVNYFVEGSTNQYHISGAWGWGSVTHHGDTLQVFVPMIGFAKIQL